MPTNSLNGGPELQIFTRETLVEGRPAQINCIDINRQTYSIVRGPVTVASLEDEWFEDVSAPEAVVEALISKSKIKPDLFTFWQRLPEAKPKYPYHLEWESIAAVPITSFDHWFNKQIKGTTRNMIRKSQKAGVEVRDCSFDDEFIRGMTRIFNETPIRQGRRFWHYGKDFEMVKRQFSRFLLREDLIGEYCGEEMVGFEMLGNAGKYGLLGQFISKLQHRDKAINNALIAHTVRTCERQKLPCLVYGYWGASSLSDFKHNSGFAEMRVPRYFVPLTAKGKVALKLRLHRGWKAALPDEIKNPLKRLRKFWLGLRADNVSREYPPNP